MNKYFILLKEQYFTYFKTNGENSYSNNLCLTVIDFLNRQMFQIFLDEHLLKNDFSCGFSSIFFTHWAAFTLNNTFTNSVLYYKDEGKFLRHPVLQWEPGR